MPAIARGTHKGSRTGLKLKRYAAIQQATPKQQSHSAGVIALRTIRFANSQW
jgi:hypothetical protein